MTDHEKQQIAELRDLPGFRLLLGAFKSYEEQLAVGIVGARTLNELTVAARVYQMFRSVREVLQSGPENVAAELEALGEQQAGLDGLDDVWRSRFGRDPIQ